MMTWYIHECYFTNIFFNLLNLLYTCYLHIEINVCKIPTHPCDLTRPLQICNREEKKKKTTIVIY
jgi:hypothetical protein